MSNSVENSVKEEVIVKGVVFEQKKFGLRNRNIPQKELGKVSASGVNKGEATMEVCRKAEKKYGKKISVRFDKNN